MNTSYLKLQHYGPVATMDQRSRVEAIAIWIFFKNCKVRIFLDFNGLSNFVVELLVFFNIIVSFTKKSRSFVLINVLIIIWLILFQVRRFKELHLVLEILFIYFHRVMINGFQPMTANVVSCLFY